MSDVLLRLFVPGRARTKGHMIAMHIPGRGGAKCKVWLKDRDETKAWMVHLKRHILGARPRGVDWAGPYGGPVELHTFFRFERTLAVANGVELMNAIPSHNTEWPTAHDIGDYDTLLRAVPDALTQAHVIADDDLVMGGMNYKRWCLPGERPGVLIVLRLAPVNGFVHDMEQAYGRG